MTKIAKNTTEINSYATQETSVDERIQMLKEYFIRAGTDYYHRLTRATAKGEEVPVLEKWKVSFIKDDFEDTGNWKQHISKYAGFVNMPFNNSNYLREIGKPGQPYKWYNLYEKLPYEPKAGDCIETLSFIKHVFGQYYEVALDYLSIIYRHPTQNLPVLCLVSRERKTGKSSFLKWLSLIYGGNAVILGNEDISGNFNSHWTSKLIIGVDETFIERKEVLEKIKRLTTSDTILNENKGKDKNRIDFFGKFILLSNDETNFVNVQEEENRYFIIRVPHIDEEKPKIELILEPEIPAFLHLLSTRQILHPNKSRLWFEPSIYETEALRKVVISSRSKIEKAIISYLQDIFDSIDDNGIEIENNTLYFAPKQLANAIQNDFKGYNGLSIDIEKLLKENWKLRPNKAVRKTLYYFNEVTMGDTKDRTLDHIQCQMRYYEITREFLESLTK